MPVPGIPTQGTLQPSTCQQGTNVQLTLEVMKNAYLAATVDDQNDFKNALEVPSPTTPDWIQGVIVGLPLDNFVATWCAMMDKVVESQIIETDIVVSPAFPTSSFNWTQGEECKL